MPAHVQAWLAARRETRQLFSRLYAQVMASWNGAEDVDPEAGGLSGVESVSSPQGVGVGEVLLRGLETLSHSRAWLRLDLRREGDAELRAEARLPGLALSEGSALGGGGRVQWTLDGLPGSPFHLELSWAEGPPPGHSEQQALERVLRAGLPAALEVDRLQSALARLSMPNVSSARCSRSPSLPVRRGTPAN